MYRCKGGLKKWTDLLEGPRLLERRICWNRGVRNTAIVNRTRVHSYGCDLHRSRHVLQETTSLAPEFDEVRFDWVQRETNKRADELIQQALSNDSPMSVMKDIQQLTPDGGGLVVGRQGKKEASP